MYICLIQCRGASVLWEVAIKYIKSIYSFNLNVGACVCLCIYISGWIYIYNIHTIRANIFMLLYINLIILIWNASSVVLCWLCLQVVIHYLCVCVCVV